MKGYILIGLAVVLVIGTAFGAPLTAEDYLAVDAGDTGEVLHDSERVERSPHGWGYGHHHHHHGHNHYGGYGGYGGYGNGGWGNRGYGGWW